MKTAVVVGVLALQGAFAKHAEVMRGLGAKVIEVRTPSDLALCDSLIIPGGESTAIMKRMQFVGFQEPLAQFANEHPVFGTCAGLILMSREIVAPQDTQQILQPFKLLNISVERNAFGRQVESFSTHVDIVAEKVFEKRKNHTLPAFFIRAPRIRQVGDLVQVLATYQGEPVLVQQGRHLGASFHPELTSDPAVHAYFLKLTQGKF